MLLKLFNPSTLLEYPLIMNTKDIMDYLNCSNTKVRKYATEKNFNSLDLGIDRILIYRDDFAKFVNDKIQGYDFYEQYKNTLNKETTHYA